MSTLRTATLARARLGLAGPDAVALARRERMQGLCSHQDIANEARRAEYASRRAGLKKALIQIWKA